MVTVYSTPTCVFCHATKEYFKAKKIEFTEKDLSTDSEAVKWVVDKTGQLSVPVIDINGAIIIGFDKPKIDIAIAK